MFRQEIKEIQETDINDRKFVEYQKQRLAERFVEQINSESESDYEVTTNKANEIYALLCSIYGM